MINSIPNEWMQVMNAFDDQYIVELLDKVEKIYKDGGNQILPKKENVFRCFSFFPPEETKVVIIGQDPYHTILKEKIVADGLAFSTNTEYTPPSLRNIFKEIKSSLGIDRSSTDLSDWAQQGVLLLNTSLTVVKSKPSSHSNLGWQHFTKKIIFELSKKYPDIIFVAWGAHAQKIATEAEIPENKTLISPHPSPFSAHKGFFGCNHFKIINEKLITANKKPIKW